MFRDTFLENRDHVFIIRREFGSGIESYPTPIDLVTATRTLHHTLGTSAWFGTVA